MKKRTHLDDDAIRDFLRAGDPVEDGGVPTAEQTARMRRRILTEEPQPRVFGRQPALVGAAATLIVALIAGWVFLGDRDPGPNRSTPRVAEGAAGGPNDGPARPITPEPAPPSRVAAMSAGPEEPKDAAAAATVQNRVRQIRISTPGGTRIIWHLDPDFDV